MLLCLIMIKVIFAPGSYGTFLSKCLYYLSDIAGGTGDCKFVFDLAGSSHDLRSVSDVKKYIQQGHPSTNGGTIQYDKNDISVVIQPCDNNRLDYYDNQFCKQEQKQIVTSLNTNFSSEEIRKKLFDGWNYNHDLDLSTPKWILREWCSFWLEDCLATSYDPLFFRTIPASVCITTQDLFVDLPGTLHRIAQAINVNIVANVRTIKIVQDDFVAAQKMHGIQMRCETWVDDTLAGRIKDSPCLTLFDEAWVQHQLRKKGYELKCDNLENLPSSTSSLADLIYPTK